MLFDVAFDRSQSALPAPVFNDGGGGHRPEAERSPGRLALCAALFSFFEVVDGQTLVKGVSCFIFENKVY